MAFSLFRNFLAFSSPSTPAAVEAEKPIMAKPSTPPKLERRDATDPSTTTELLVSIIERDGGVIVENIISQGLATQIKSDLKPYFDTDRVDPSGFFPHTTQRATGLIAKSDACVELACNPTFINVANSMLSSTYTYWTGQTQETVTGKPIISSTVGFRVNPGGRQQALHRDDGSVNHKQVLHKCLQANLFGSSK
jgi:ectoine hydroxylase-related dioxygenase (phytanoyl-CoA dioxygenase family)